MTIHLTFAIIALFCLSSCTTFHGQKQRQAEARHTMELQNIRSNIERLKTQTEIIADEREGMYEDIRYAKSRLDEIERLLDGAEAARTRDKQEILGLLSAQISEILKSQQPAHISDTGYEHMVEAGQTLSDIALAYKVTVQSIVQANNLPNANNITAGQKLFIPE